MKYNISGRERLEWKKVCIRQKKNTEVIEKKLESILNDAEEQKTFNSQNFVSLKTLVFIWVIGSETKPQKSRAAF